MYSLKQISEITGGNLYGEGIIQVTDLIYDSRKIHSSASALFVAIRTDKGDGHLYLPSIAEAGIQAALVEENPGIEGLSCVVVEDSIKALQRLAAYHRSTFSIPVIGITGSNGKTIVKEWLSVLLQPKYNTHKSPKSYNSQIGVALSVWSLNKTHDMAIIEAGISQPGEMDALYQIIQPGIGILTHMGDAHGINFDSIEEKIREKLKLFERSDVLIHRADERVQKVLETTALPTLCWGEEQTCDIVVRQLNKQTVELTYEGVVHNFTLPFQDEASKENCVHCLCCCLYLGLDEVEISSKLNDLRAVDMRLQQVDGIHNSSLVLDYYNADIDSLKHALDFQSQQAMQKEKIVVLSDIVDSSIAQQELYETIALLLEKSNIDKLIGIGPEIGSQKERFGMNTHFYNSTDEFLNAHPFYQLANASVLIKGARKYRFERIVERLKAQVHRTSLEVNMSRMQENLNHFKRQLPKASKVMAMVKAYSYGSGGYQVAKLLEHNHIDYLGVAYIDEGVALRNAGIHSKIMVLNPDLEQIDSLMEYDLEPVIFSQQGLKKLSEQTSSTVGIHLEFDTGMHRLGLLKEELEQITTAIKHNKGLVVKSVFSHLASADDPDQDTLTNRQIDDFKRICQQLSRAVGEPFLKHIANTAGIQRFPEAHFDMVRLGIGLYGIGALNRDEEGLLAVGTFKSYIAQIRMVKAGDGIGYGQYDAAEHERRIAVIAVGYADGFNRAFSRGKGQFSINGKLAKVVGNVCMDMTMCDVTNIDCKEGDEVIIFGDQPSVEHLAKELGTIPYEVLTSVSERVTRVFYQE